MRTTSARCIKRSTRETTQRRGDVAAQLAAQTGVAVRAAAANSVLRFHRNAFAATASTPDRVQLRKFLSVSR